MITPFSLPLGWTYALILSYSPGAFLLDSYPSPCTALSPQDNERQARSDALSSTWRVARIADRAAESFMPRVKQSVFLRLQERLGVVFEPHSNRKGKAEKELLR